MRYRKGCWYAAVLALAVMVVLPGCASYSAGFASVETAAANRDIDSAIKSLEQLRLSNNDEVLLYLNKATLLRLQGNYEASNREFEAAKSLMETLSAISIAEQSASLVVNDTMKAYEGSPCDQLMVYPFAALNYLQMHDVDAAAVEARQFDVKQGLIAKNYPDATYLSGAFGRYLNSMVYEAVGETDSARIEMHKALDAYRSQNSGFAVPKGLRADLQRLKARLPAPSEVVFVLHNGLGPFLTDTTAHVPNPNPMEGTAFFSISLPKFVARPAPIEHFVLSTDSVSTTSERVEDINTLAEKTLNDRLPIITARAVSRMVVKNMAAAAAKKQSQEMGSNLSIFVNLVIDASAVVSEVADTRSWSLLPGSIDMARLSLPAGKHNLTATYYDKYGNILDRREYRDIVVEAGRKSFLSDYYLKSP